MFPFSDQAFAMPGGGEGGGGALVQFLPFVLIFVIFWFLIIRPQQRKSKAHRELLSSLSKGDKVKTDGGIHGTIEKLSDDSVTLEIANKVAIRIDRGHIAEVIKSSKNPPAKANKNDEDDSSEQ